MMNRSTTQFFPPRMLELLNEAKVMEAGVTFRDADVRPTKLYIDIDATYLRQVARELRQNCEMTSTINARRLQQ
jgi:hypothetical protein